jgi:hypothetical protein
MSDMADTIQLGLLHGLIISLLLTVVLMLSLMINAEMWLNDYPPDVREKYGQMSDETRRQRGPLAAAFFGVIIITLSIGVGKILSASPGESVFFALFVYSFVALFTFNLYDLLILDWLIFVAIQPKFVILPGTEGMSGYKDYSFHFKGFLVGIGYSTAAGLLVAGIGSLINLVIN